MVRVVAALVLDRVHRTVSICVEGAVEGNQHCGWLMKMITIQIPSESRDGSNYKTKTMENGRFCPWSLLFF